MDKIKIIVVSSSTDERSAALDILENIDYIEVADDAKSGRQGLKLLGDLLPDLVLLGSGTDHDGYEVAREMHRRKPGVPVIMIERELNEDTVRRAVAAGVKDIVLHPVEPSRLVQAITAGMQDKEAKEAGRDETAGGQDDGSVRGRIFTFFSTKGGVGKTFSSVNLAAALAANGENKVALVDLDLEYGSAAMAFNIFTTRNLVELVDEIHMLDQDLLESYLVPHESGVKVLPAGNGSPSSEWISGNHLEIILNELASTYHYVLVDMPVRLTGSLDPAIQEADLLFLVATPEVSSIRNIRLVLKMITAAGYPHSKVRVVLNRDDPRSGIKAGDVETTLKEKLFTIIPADYKRAAYSLNRGLPIVQLFPRAKVSKAFKKLAAKLNEHDKTATGGNR